MKLSEVKKILGKHAVFIGDDAEFYNLSIDTRTLQRGDFFVVIKGENFDGHDFVAGARDAGACGALVERRVDADLPQIIVPDARIALGKLGAWQRSQFAIPLIAVTGTCGKTTVKEMIASILRQCGKTLANIKSFNSDIGVPLTLWKLQEQYDYAVLEVGANHFGEITYLTHLVKPQVAVITNAGPGHLEGFRNVAGVARAKGEIFAGLTTNGIAVLNADDEHFNYWHKLVKELGHKIITFGFGADVDVRATETRMNDLGMPSFVLHIAVTNEADKADKTDKVNQAGQTAEVKLPLLGQHNVANALAAAAACYAINVPIAAIKAGLESTQPVYMRLIIKRGINGADIIDDTYNAIPTAVIAALQYLAMQPKKKIFVFGEMRELGAEAEHWHKIISKKARELGIDEVYTLGAFAKQVAETFGARAKVFSSKKQLIAELKKTLDADKIVLVKGSRGAKMEDIVNAILY